MKRSLLVFVFFSSLAFAEQKFACVDPTRILSESQLVKEREAKLRAKAEEYQKQFDQINRRMEELKRQIESRGIAQSVREQRMKEYQRLETEIMELQQKAQREFSEMKTRMEEELINKVKSISEDIAQKQGFTGVLDCSVFIYRPANIDITKEVIQKLDQQK